MTTGWLRVVAGGTVVCDQALETDLEKFWAFYQEDVLRAVVGHVRKKTGDEPTFSKQPYFKRLLVDLRASEPDFRTGIDEEIVSSLEAMHDEIYFDTLDLLRGITRFDPEDKDAAADTSRSSAPGNVLPSLHPSLEGGPAKVRAVLEDWPAAAPQAVIRWKEKGHEEVSRKSVFPALKPKTTRATSSSTTGAPAASPTSSSSRSGRRRPTISPSSTCSAPGAGCSTPASSRTRSACPRLDAVTLRLRYQSREKDERLPVVPPSPAAQAPPPPPRPDESLVTTRDIISPAMAGDIVRRLSALKGVRSYVGGQVLRRPRRARPRALPAARARMFPCRA